VRWQELYLPLPLLQVIGKNRILRRLLGYTYSKYGPGAFQVRVEGSIMFFPKDSLSLALLMASGSYEKHLTYFVKRIVRNGMVTVDVGAGFGYYTLLLSKLVSSEGRVHVFEPEPSRYKFLLANIKINRCTNVVVNNLAVSNKSGKAKMYVHGETSSLYVRNYSEHIVEVNTITLDEYFEEHGGGKVHLIKIDAEGSEPYILLGAEKILRKTEILITEFCPRTLKSSGYSSVDFLKLLKNQNFAVYYLEGSQTKDVSSIDLISYMSRKKIESVNLVCFKRRSGSV